MSIRTLSRVSLIVLLAASMSGCATWNSMSPNARATIGGAAIGAVAGAVIFGGAVATVGGAAVGGLVGDLLTH